MAPIPKSPPPRPVKRAPVRKAPAKKKPAVRTANRTRTPPKPAAATPAKNKPASKTASPQFERGRTHEVARTKTSNAGQPQKTPRLSDDPARTRSLDKMQDLERRQAGVERDLRDAPEPKTDAARRDLAARADQVDRLRDERTRESGKLYGHLMQAPPSRYGAPGDRTMPNDTGQRIVAMNPAQRDAALKNMSPGERRQVSDQIRSAERDVEQKLKGLQERAADDDPRVVAARKELEQLRAAEKKADDRYHDAYRGVRDREEGTFGHRVLGSLYSDPHAIAAKETATEKRAYDDARTRVRDAERELRALEKDAPLSAAAREARAKLVEEKRGLEAARERVALGPASRADAEAWLGAGADARNEQLAGGLPADQAESMASHLHKMRDELKTAPPGETPDARAAREAKLEEIDTASARLQDRRLSPDLFDWSQRTQDRMDALRGLRRPLTAAEQKEMRDLGTAMTGLGQLSPGELMNDWGHWERGHGDALAQPGLQKEWEAHVAENPQALRDLDRDVAAAREQALNRLTPEQRADFEKNFELQTRFGRDGEGNLTYGVGYVPTQAMADKQIEQSLGAGLHHSQPAMEIGHHYRVQEHARPQNPAAAAQWWQQFGQAGAGDLKTHSGGGGLQPTYDEMLIIPTGSLMRAAGSTFGRAAVTQFGRNAAREIATNVAFDAAINTVGNAVSDRFGEKWGAAVPFAAVAATLLTGRVMRSPGVQAARQRIGDRVRQALPERFGGTPRTARTPDVNAPRTTGAPAATRRAATPLDKPMVIDDSVRHLGVDAKDHIDLINKHGLQPKHNVTVDNVNYSMSDPFDIGHGRVAVLGVVDDGTQKTLRAFYRSNSQGNFRLLPAQNQGLGHLGLPGYDKGLGEHMLNLPSQVDETLAGLVRGNKVRTDIPVDDAGRLFAGASPINRTPADYFAYRDSPDFVGNGVTQRTIAPGAGKGRNARMPQDVQVPPEQMPRFDQPPVRTYKTNTSTAGEVDAMVYRSADDSLEYTLFKGQDGRVWVANVADSSSPITRHGVRQQAVDAGELEIPRWEYHQQIPQGFEGAAHPSMGNAYGDAWAYLRELPLIQSYYSAQGLPVPR